MKTLVVFFVILTAFSAGALPTAYEDGVEDYPRFFDMYDDIGNLRRVDLEEQPDETILASITKSRALNEYWLYTRSNPTHPQYLYIDQPASVINSNFNVSRPVAVTVHGWINNGHTEPNSALIPVLLAKDDYNVIALDWSRLANLAYTTSVLAVPYVGQELGRFMGFLNGLGVPWTNMHLIGFSLGGHVVGSAGREVGGRIARITSLDPAGPLFRLNPNRIRSTDAVYVEGIHTDGGLQGIGTAIGDVDFFPNGGSIQPGCSGSSCNHHRAWQLLAATITNNHLWGNLCVNMEEVSSNACTGPLYPMGNDNLTKSGSGIYRVNTNSAYPY